MLLKSGKVWRLDSNEYLQNLFLPILKSLYLEPEANNKTDCGLSEYLLLKLISITSFWFHF